MVKLTYPLCSSVRILLPFAAILMILPCVFREQLMNYITFPIFYFWGSYFVFLNFPSISYTLHSKPTYINDLVINTDNEKFKTIYTVIMNFILALLFSVFAEYLIIQGVDNRPVIEVLGIIGGNLGLYVKAQGIVGKILLVICYNMKEKAKRKISIDENKEENKAVTE